jgi:O-6-methylguanine DNA methyltransferase
MAAFVFESPIGPLYVEVTPRGLRRLDLLSAERSLNSRKRVHLEPSDDARVTAEERELAESLAQQLEEYFEGSRNDFDLPLDIDPRAGSAFQQRVWQTIATIPHGEVLSYAEIAIRAGYPNAFRAVGTACGANPIALVIPCHRVVASGGKLGGYGGGLESKVWLLRHEGFECGEARKDAPVKTRAAVGV